MNKKKYRKGTKNWIALFVSFKFLTLFFLVICSSFIIIFSYIHFQDPAESFLSKINDHASFEPPKRQIKFFGISRRLKNQRGKFFPHDINIKWGESGNYTKKSIRILKRMLKQINVNYTFETMLQHQKDAAAHLIENKNYLCPATNTNGNGFVWVEDDAIPCLNFLEHLNLIFDLFREITYLAGKNTRYLRLVYVRTSFGFNGLVVRCEKFHKFILAILKSGDKQGIDDEVALFLLNHVATYRWNLFAHPKIIPRDESIPRCYDYNFFTMIFADYYDSECLKSRSLLSPCNRFMWNDMSLQKNQNLYPEFPVKFDMDDPLFKSSNLSIEITNENITCTQQCTNSRKVCSFDGILKLSILLRFGVVPDQLKCDRITSNGHLKAYPRMDQDVCVTRFIDEDNPVYYLAQCDFPFKERICVCI